MGAHGVSFGRKRGTVDAFLAFLLFFFFFFFFSCPFFLVALLLDEGHTRSRKLIFHNTQLFVVRGDAPVFLLSPTFPELTFQAALAVDQRMINTPGAVPFFFFSHLSLLLSSRRRVKCEEIRREEAEGSGDPAEACRSLSSFSSSQPLPSSGVVSRCSGEVRRD